MFLKRIELIGFKSFADKTELEFVPGITAVVGPNGSGKSNISDGIRWVLGEQSAKSLRGGKMEDVIFAGSDSRKAVNFGEVSLTLDNDDYALPLDFSEVSVTRRIHRSGDSEYFINKQPCRLKDITELFMDTGIGKEAYSIIGQGRIEEILSTRSEDRRGIFEEASGIVKYKSRKKEAQKKLDETEQNLLRIHDLIAELEDQLEPLQEQSDKAIEFKKLKEELKSNEISMYVHQIEQVHQSWTESGEKLKELEQRQLELSTEVSLHDAEMEKQRLEARRVEQELERLHEELLHFSEEHDKCVGFGEVLKEREKNYAQNLKQSREAMDQIEQKIGLKEAERDQLQHKSAEVGLRLSELKAKLREEERRLLGVNEEADDREVEGLKAELLDQLNQMAQQRNEIRYLAQQRETLSRRGNKLDEDRQNWTEQKEALSVRREQLQAAAEQAASEIVAIRDRYLSLSQEQKAKQDLLEEAQQTVRKWEQKQEALVSRRDTMLEMQNDFDGFMHGVREVLKSRKQSGGLRGVHGAVAELIRVPAKVEMAVETSLGASLQHIVMEDEASAREAIAYLKRRQAGRATFLPLDVIRGRSIPASEQASLRTEPGFVGIAADLVQFDPLYAEVVGSLLGNVIIAEKLEQANRIAGKSRYRYRVVTLEGDVVHAGGSMTGGSQQKKSVSLLGRQRQIDQMGEEISRSEAQLAALREKAGELRKELEDIKSELEQCRGQGEQKRLEEQRILSEIGQLASELKQAEAQLSFLETDRQSASTEGLELEQRQGELAENLRANELREAELQRAIEQAEHRRRMNQSAKEELQSGLTELKINVAGTEQEKLAIDEQIRRCASEWEAELGLLEEKRELLRALQAEMEQNERDSVQQIENLNHYAIKKKECSERIDLMRADRAEWVRLQELGENETREQRNQLKRVEEQLHQTEVRVNRLDVELENLLRKLSDDYEIGYELAKQRYPVPEDIPGTQDRVRELKRRISLLGEVNLGAIDEFRRISERFEFLSGQENDLIEAKTTLYQVIREMDEEMSKKFASTFEAIRSQFAVVFTRMFGGGRADLILSDPERLLETGVDIVAQPPGKKLQNLQLLSGGERALTAIALLFAILLVKPVPFCVLDEVEAALDDANVSRFAEYLREFSQETQFIVVTHRKGTMEEADVLYGVTMEEDGVSKLVSVRLEDEQPVSA